MSDQMDIDKEDADVLQPPSRIRIGLSILWNSIFYTICAISIWAVLSYFDEFVARDRVSQLIEMQITEYSQVTTSGPNPSSSNSPLIGQQVHVSDACRELSARAKSDEGLTEAETIRLNGGECESDRSAVRKPKRGFSGTRVDILDYLASAQDMLSIIRNHGQNTMANLYTIQPLVVGSYDSETRDAVDRFDDLFTLGRLCEIQRYEQVHGPIDQENTEETGANIDTENQSNQTPQTFTRNPKDPAVTDAECDSYFTNYLGPAIASRYSTRDILRVKRQSDQSLIMTIMILCGMLGFAIYLLRGQIARHNRYREQLRQLNKKEKLFEGIRLIQTQRLLLGALAGFTAYLVLTGAKFLVVVNANIDSVAFNPFTVALVALMAGLFTDRAYDFLSKAMQDAKADQPLDPPSPTSQ